MLCAGFILVGCTARTERGVATWKDKGAANRGVRSQGRQAQEDEGGVLLLLHRFVEGAAGSMTRRI